MTQDAYIHTIYVARNRSIRERDTTRRLSGDYGCDVGLPEQPGWRVGLYRATLGLAC